MTVAWPSTLPIPKRAGHTYQPKMVTNRAEMNGGAARVRQMFSDRTTSFNINFILDVDQRKVFETYFKYDLKNGAEEFYLTVDSADGIGQKRARFIGTPSFDTSTGRNTVAVSASVEILESLIPAADPEDLQYQLLDTDGSDTFLDCGDASLLAFAPPIETLT